MVGRERGKKEQRKKKEEGLGPNRYRDKDVSLVSALLRYKGTNEVDALPTDVVRSILRVSPSLAPFYAPGASGWLAPCAWV
jgi:hypothetical protein